MNGTNTLHEPRLGLVTGASRGLGQALTRGLAAAGWSLIIDGRDARSLARAERSLSELVDVTAIDGDVADPVHRQALAAAVADRGRLDLLVANAGTLGPSPLPRLDAITEADLDEVFRINAVAQMMLVQAALPALEAASGIVMAITSDAAHGGWEGWGAYGASKAALEQLMNVLATEHPALAVYSVDPGDLRTDMHQRAFPGEDISDRPEPESVVAPMLALIRQRPQSGRYEASAFQEVTR